MTWLWVRPGVPCERVGGQGLQRDLRTAWKKSLCLAATSFPARPRPGLLLPLSPGRRLQAPSWCRGAGVRALRALASSEEMGSVSRSDPGHRTRGGAQQAAALHQQPPGPWQPGMAGDRPWVGLQTSTAGSVTWALPKAWEEVPR